MIKVLPFSYPWRGLQVKMLLLCKGQKTILIDTGAEDAIKLAIQPVFQQNNLDFQDLALIINTHFHSDHIGCNGELKRRSSAPVAIHRNGAEHLFPAPDLLLEEGQQIRFGGMELEIIHTPGHSPDSICVLELSTGTLFSGDSIQGTGIDVIGPGLWRNTADYLQSLEKLRRICRTGKIKRLCTGHDFSPSGSDFYGAEIDLFLRDSIRFSEGCTALAQKMRHDSPDQFYNALLQFCGSTPAPEWEGIARSMADFLHQEAAE